jgi:hypothetical protein
MPLAQWQESLDARFLRLALLSREDWLRMGLVVAMLPV